MEEKNIIQNEVATPVEEIADSEVAAKTLPKKPKSNYKDEIYKEKKCKVIAYNQRTKVLDVDFDGYGVRVLGISNFGGDVATIKYKGEIGKANFTYKI